ncbi:hypothetical protein BESB_045070 [Besnoitia besnoiti]|uniref:Uncharacterized protein n=1 Tax=Besnoitia besnoiti TaxID=94643 RepID=A0A2A9ME99_BESBE|nr:hypothetical protein BESB_045070 [Besnoitia besnoiti]PFH36315.1 hypothetical protein BESB_045070 [Besnoitia besnoiti]
MAPNTAESPLGRGEDGGKAVLGKEERRGDAELETTAALLADASPYSVGNSEGVAGVSPALAATHADEESAKQDSDADAPAKSPRRDAPVFLKLDALVGGTEGLSLGPAGLLEAADSPSIPLETAAGGGGRVRSVAPATSSIRVPPVMPVSADGFAAHAHRGNVVAAVTRGGSDASHAQKLREGPAKRPSGAAARGLARAGSEETGLRGEEGPSREGDGAQAPRRANVPAGAACRLSSTGSAGGSGGGAVSYLDDFYMRQRTRAEHEAQRREEARREMATWHGAPASKEFQWLQRLRELHAAASPAPAGAAQGSAAAVGSSAGRGGGLRGEAKRGGVIGRRVPAVAQKIESVTEETNSRLVKHLVSLFQARDRTKRPEARHGGAQEGVGWQGSAAYGSSSSSAPSKGAGAQRGKREDAPISFYRYGRFAGGSAAARPTTRRTSSDSSSYAGASPPSSARTPRQRLPNGIPAHVARLPSGGAALPYQKQWTAPPSGAAVAYFPAPMGRWVARRRGAPVVGASGSPAGPGGRGPAAPEEGRLDRIITRQATAEILPLRFPSMTCGNARGAYRVSASSRSAAAQSRPPSLSREEVLVIQDALMRYRAQQQQGQPRFPQLGLGVLGLTHGPAAPAAAGTRHAFAVAGLPVAGAAPQQPSPGGAQELAQAPAGSRASSAVVPAGHRSRSHASAKAPVASASVAPQSGVVAPQEEEKRPGSLLEKREGDKRGEAGGGQQEMKLEAACDASRDAHQASSPTPEAAAEYSAEPVVSAATGPPEACEMDAPAAGTSPSGDASPRDRHPPAASKSATEGGAPATSPQPEGDDTAKRYSPAEADSRAAEDAERSEPEGPPCSSKPTREHVGGLSSLTTTPNCGDSRGQSEEIPPQDHSSGDASRVPQGGSAEPPASRQGLEPSASGSLGEGEASEPSEPEETEGELADAHAAAAFAKHQVAQESLLCLADCFAAAASNVAALERATRAEAGEDEDSGLGGEAQENAEGSAEGGDGKAPEGDSEAQLKPYEQIMLKFLHYRDWWEAQAQKADQGEARALDDLLSVVDNAAGDGAQQPGERRSRLDFDEDAQKVLEIDALLEAIPDLRGDTFSFGGLDAFDASHQAADTGLFDFHFADEDGIVLFSDDDFDDGREYSNFSEERERGFSGEAKAAGHASAGDLESSPSVADPQRLSTPQLEDEASHAETHSGRAQEGKAVQGKDIATTIRASELLRAHYLVGPLRVSQLAAGTSGSLGIDELSAAARDNGGASNQVCQADDAEEALQ